MPDLPISRRTLAYGLALSAFAAPKRLDVPHPDAALLDLGRRIAEAEEQWEVARQSVEAAHACYVQPQPPEALFYRSVDGLMFRVGAERRGGRLWLGSDIENIRQLPCGYSCEAEDGSTVWFPNARDAARRDEIVAAYEAWRADCDAAQDAVGLIAAEAEFDAAADAATILRREIIATPVTTLAGIMVKARAAGWCFGGVDGLSDEIGDAPSDNGETIALIVVRDLLILAERRELAA